MARVTNKQISEAIEKYSGNITAVAKSLGVNRSTIYRRTAKSTKLQEDLTSARETMLDNVESTLYKQALEGNTTAMIFFLKTQGKSRGYVERQEHAGVDGKEITFKVIKGDDTES